MNVIALLSCLHCGNPLRYDTEGGNQWERRAVLTCLHCPETHVLTVRLTSTKGVAA